MPGPFVPSQQAGYSLSDAHAAEIEADRQRNVKDRGGEGEMGERGDRHTGRETGR